MAPFCHVMARNGQDLIFVKHFRNGGGPESDYGQIAKIVKNGQINDQIIKKKSNFGFNWIYKPILVQIGWKKPPKL